MSGNTRIATAIHIMTSLAFSEESMKGLPGLLPDRGLLKNVFDQAEDAVRDRFQSVKLSDLTKRIGLK